MPPGSLQVAFVLSAPQTGPKAAAILFTFVQLLQLRRQSKVAKLFPAQSLLLFPFFRSSSPSLALPVDVPFTVNMPGPALKCWPLATEYIMGAFTGHANEFLN